MSKLSILPSANLSMPGPTRVTAKDIAGAPPPGQIASRQYLATTNNNATIAIETTEGDTVTLNYKSSTTKKNYLRQAGTEIPGLEESQATHKEIAINIEGELSEQEKSDLAVFKEEVSAILDTYFAARANNGNDQVTLDLSKYQALSKYALALDSSSSTSSATEMVVAVARPVVDTVEVESQQQAALTHLNDDLTTFAVSKDEKITKQESHLQFDYVATRLQRRSLEVAGQISQPLGNNDLVVQQQTYDKKGKSLTGQQSIVEPITMPDFSELRSATQEIFAQQRAFFINDTTTQKLNALEKVFLGLLDQLAVNKETRDGQQTIRTTA